MSLDLGRAPRARRLVWIGGPYDGASIPVPDPYDVVIVEDVDGWHVCPVAGAEILWREAIGPTT